MNLSQFPEKKKSLPVKSSKKLKFTFTFSTTAYVPCYNHKWALRFLCTVNSTDVGSPRKKKRTQKLPNFDEGVTFLSSENGVLCLS